MKYFLPFICILCACNAHFYKVPAPTTMTIKDAKDSIIMVQPVQGKFAVDMKYLPDGIYTIAIGNTTHTVQKH